uniref:F-box domain-containing protein n=1 Tax=Panagrellus redivivus TaxID=6233 RepID=A0A7E4ZSZ5_PANRE
MPYPILTLPYPFARRLRQLLDPFELELLQHAAGNAVTSELKPIVVSHKGDRAVFEQVFEHFPNPIPVYKLKLHCDQITLNISKKDQKLIKCEIVEFSELSNSTLENFNLDQLMVNVVRITFRKCHISNAFLEKVSKIVLHPRGLDMGYCTNIDEDVKFSTILKIFPYVNCVAIGTSYFGWLDDLVSTGRQLDIVEVLHNNFEEMFSFRPDELYEFVTKQCPEFYMHLYVKTNDIAETVDKIKPYIDPRFDTDVRGYAKIYVTVTLHHIWTGCYSKIYYYKNMQKKK